MTPPFLTTTVPADRPHAVLSCSITVGCAVTLPPREQLRHVVVGDERYTVQVAEDGSRLPARILIYPTREMGAAEPTSLDIADSARSYTVLIQPSTNTTMHTLQFTPRIAQPEPTPLGETATLDPTRMIFGNWRYQGDALLGCQSLFEYDAALWCKLPTNVTKAPSVYGIVGKMRQPIDARIVNRSYLVIQSTDGPFELDLMLGGSEHRGRLEHV